VEHPSTSGMSTQRHQPDEVVRAEGHAEVRLPSVAAIKIDDDVLSPDPPIDPVRIRWQREDKWYAFGSPAESGEQGDGAAANPGGKDVAEVGEQRAPLQAAGSPTPTCAAASRAFDRYAQVRVSCDGEETADDHIVGGVD